MHPGKARAAQEVEAATSRVEQGEAMRPRAARPGEGSAPSSPQP